MKRLGLTNAQFTTKSSRSQMLTSCPLALASILFIAWDFIFSAFLLGCLIYKGVRLIYPVYMFIIELILIIVYFVIAVASFSITKTGNFKEQVAPLIVAIVISFLLCLVHIYFLRLQVYVLLAEVIMSSIGIFIKVLQMLLLAIVAISFLRKMY